MDFLTLILPAQFQFGAVATQDDHFGSEIPSNEQAGSSSGGPSSQCVIA